MPLGCSTKFNYVLVVKQKTLQNVLCICIHDKQVRFSLKKNDKHVRILAKKNTSYWMRFLIGEMKSYKVTFDMGLRFKYI